MNSSNFSDLILAWAPMNSSNFFKDLILVWAPMNSSNFFKDLILEWAQSTHTYTLQRNLLQSSTPSTPSTFSYRKTSIQKGELPK